MSYLGDDNNSMPRLVANVNEGNVTAYDSFPTNSTGSLKELGMEDARRSTEVIGAVSNSTPFSFPSIFFSLYYEGYWCHH